MKEDVIDISILADGTLRVETSKVSGPNHQNAEQFLREMGRLAGGETTRSRRDNHKHQHNHTHEHEHEHEKH